MTTAIIVQARMTSTRLPGKVLLPVAGRPLLAYLLERLRRARKAHRIVIATTTNTNDEAIVDFCASEGVDCTRGSETDVLRRYFEAATRFQADTLVRITSDCPLIDPGLVDLAIDSYLQHAGDIDYLSNMVTPSWPYGFAVEVFSYQALAEANAEATQEAEREHVTPFIYWRPERYRIQSLTTHPDTSQHRLTVDTPEDFELIKRIIETLYPNNPCFTLPDVLKLLDEHQDWQLINRHIQQKLAQPAEKNDEL